MQTPITQKQAAALVAVHDLSLVRQGIPPTIREVAEVVGVNHLSQMYYILRSLKEKGLILHHRGKARGHVMTEKGIEWVKARGKEVSP